MSEDIATDIEQIEEVSMEDTIRDTLRGLQEKGIELEETPVDDVEKAEKIRDEKGKFKAKEQAPTKQVAEAVTEAPTEPIQAPVDTQKLGLRKEEAEEFLKAPKLLQDAYMRRFDEMHKGFEQYKAKAQFAENVERNLQPYMATINSFGVAPEAAIQGLFKADHALRYGNENQKLNMATKILGDYGIDPNKLFERLQNGAPQLDPTVSALQQEVYQLKAQQQQQYLTAQQQEQQTLNSELMKFSSDPEHKHFEGVRNHMAALLQAGIVDNLKDAYDQAVLANPTTRALVLAEQQNKEREEATRKAKEAKEAASINTRTRPSMPTSQPIGSMDDTIRNTFRRLTAS